MELYLKFFFLLTPFFALSVFLTMTAEYSPAQKRRLALLVGFSGLVITMILLYAGGWLFRVFGITVDSFRIGGGLLLLLSGIGMVNSRPIDKAHQKSDTNSTATAGEAETDSDPMQIAVVPLAIPVIIGPATISMLLIMGAELNGFAQYLRTSVALAAAMCTVSLMLYLSGWLERRLGRLGLTILSKITGLILVALASQLITQGIKQILIP